MEATNSNEQQPRPLRAGDRVLTFVDAQEVKMFITRELIPFFKNFKANHPGIKSSKDPLFGYSTDLYDEFMILQDRNWGVVDFETIEKGILTTNVFAKSKDPWGCRTILVFFVKWLWKALYSAAKGDKIVIGSHNIILHANDALFEEVTRAAESHKIEEKNKTLEARIVRLERLVDFLTNNKNFQPVALPFQEQQQMEEIE